MTSDESLTIINKNNSENSNKNGNNIYKIYHGESGRKIDQISALLLGHEIGNAFTDNKEIVPYQPVTVEKIIERQSQMPTMKTVGAIVAIIVLLVAAILYIIKMLTKKRQPQISEA